MIQAPGALGCTYGGYGTGCPIIRTMRRQIIAVHRPEDLTIIGRPDRVAAILRTAERERRLLTDPAEIARTFVRLPDGRVSTRVRLLVAQAPPTPSRGPLWRGIAVATALLVVLAGGLYAVAQVVLAAVHGSAVAVAGVALPLLVAWAVLSVRRKHACRGMHCEGCGHR